MNSKEVNQTKSKPTKPTQPNCNDLPSCENLQERLKEYIFYAQGRVDFYVDSMKIFLNLSIALITALLSIIAIIITIDPIIDKSIFLSFIPSAVIFFYDILYFAMGGNTKNDDNNDFTMWFFKGNKDNFFQKTQTELLKDDENQLQVLFKYQENYREMQIRMGRIFLIGVLSLISIPTFLFTKNPGILITQIISYFLIGLIYTCYERSRENKGKLSERVKIHKRKIFLMVIIISLSISIQILCEIYL